MTDGSNARFPAGLSLALLLAGAVAGCNQKNSADYRVVPRDQTGGAAAAGESGSAAAETSPAAISPATSPSGETSAEASNGKTPADKPAEGSPETATSGTSTTSPPAPNTAATTPPATANSGGSEPASDEPVRDPEFRREGPEEALRVSFDDIDMLRILKVEKVPADVMTRLPDWLRKLNGQKVRIRGFMYPAFEDTGLRGFTFVRDENCFYGQNANVFHFAEVTMRKGKTADYINGRPFDVVGVFRLGEEAERGQLYALDDAIVIVK